MRIYLSPHHSAHTLRRRHSTFSSFFSSLLCHRTPHDPQDMTLPCRIKSCSDFPEDSSSVSF